MEVLYIQVLSPLSHYPLSFCLLFPPFPPMWILLQFLFRVLQISFCLSVRALSHPEQKLEHSFRKLIIWFVHFSIGIIRIRVMTIIELYDMKTTAVHVKVDVSFFKIRSNRLPDSYLRMQPLDLTPGSITNSLAVHLWRYKWTRRLGFLFSRSLCPL